MRILFALPGFHKYDRGAEIALLSVARELAQAGDNITVAGSGHPREDDRYRFVHVPSIRRERFERFPRLPAFRDETAWEDLTFAAGLLARFRPGDFHATVTCSFPYTHWALRRPAAQRPAHFFVTQNGDWPARATNAEYRYFDCAGLVCINPDYYAANRQRWNCALIPNGIDLPRFANAAGDRAALGIPTHRPVVLMVSALIASKRVLDAIRAVARLDNAVLVVAGDGPQRAEADALAARLMPDRFRRLSLAPSAMPTLYRSADVFLHMSDSEPFGNVYLESWASGLPIVAHDNDRSRWIMGDEQYLCDTHDQDAVVERLKAALRQGSRASPLGLARFEWPVVAQAYREFFERTLQTRLTDGAG